MGVPTTKAGEIRPYRAGRCVSHGSLGFSISFPDTGLCQGESEKELSLLLLHRQSSHCGGKKKTPKRDKLHSSQTFGLVSKWGSVVISALSPQSPRSSLSRARCSRASPRCDPACTDSSRGTVNPFICGFSYLPLADGWEEPAPLRSAQTPWGKQGISQPNPRSECKNTREVTRRKKAGGGGGRLKNLQTNLKE